MARTFDGTDDEIRTSIGNAGVTGAVTMVAVMRRNSTAYNGIMGLHTSGGSATYSIEIADTTGSFDFTGKVDWTTGLTINNADGWVFVAATKAAGTIAPRGHRYAYAVGTWIHTPGMSTVADGASVAGGTVRFGEWQDVDDFAGELAIAAVFNASLTDAQIELLAHDLNSWYALNPVGLWIFDQAAVGTLHDLTGGGANQSAITGTSVGASAPSGLHYGGRPLLETVSEPGGGVTVTPSTAAVTLAAFAPTVTTTATQQVVPTTASLVTTAFEPTVSTPVMVTPGVATLATATFAPSVLTPVLATPDTAALVLTAFEPTATVEAVAPTLVFTYAGHPRQKVGETS